MKRLFGVIPAMLTPFTKERAIDHESLRELTDFLVDKGVHGLYPLGTNGEMFRLRTEERMRVAETVVKQAKGRCNVFIHCGANIPDDTIALVRHAESIGADGAGVVTPTFFGLSSAEKVAYYTTVAGSVSKDFPIYLYSIPQLANNDLPLDVVKEIAAKCDNVVGIKFSSPDVMLLMDYLAVRDGEFSVLPGFEKLLLPALACGCDGAISGVASVFPEPFIALYNAFAVGDLKEAQRLSKICSTFIKTMKFGCSFAYLKAALKLRGLKSGFVRLPSIELTPTEIEELETNMQALPAIQGA